MKERLSRGMLLTMMVCTLAAVGAPMAWAESGDEGATPRASAASTSAAPTAVQAKGRYKADGDLCNWDASDTGPNQCEPIIPGRFKKSGNACTWSSSDNGADECKPAEGRWKDEGGKCVWDPKDSGPNQCNPRKKK